LTVQENTKTWQFLPEAVDEAADEAASVAAIEEEEIGNPIPYR